MILIMRTMTTLKSPMCKYTLNQPTPSVLQSAPSVPQSVPAVPQPMGQAAGGYSYQFTSNDIDSEADEIVQMDTTEQVVPI